MQSIPRSRSIWRAAVPRAAASAGAEAAISRSRRGRRRRPQAPRTLSRTQKYSFRYSGYRRSYTRGPRAAAPQCGTADTACPASPREFRNGGGQDCEDGEAQAADFRRRHEYLLVQHVSACQPWSWRRAHFTAVRKVNGDLDRLTAWMRGHRQSSRSRKTAISECWA